MKLPMTRRRLCLCLLLLLVALLLLPAVHWRLIGWVKGEAFYQGRPTSYWKWDCQQWEHVPAILGPAYWRKTRSARWDNSVREWLGISTQPTPESPPLFSADPDALPVLLELLDLDDEPSQRIAIVGIRIIGPAGKAASPRLLQLIRGRSRLDMHAWEALQVVDPETASVLGRK